MYAYIARQPILDLAKNVVGYELLFRDGDTNCFPNINPDQATSSILAQNHLTHGLERITANLPAFINFHADTIIRRFPSFLDPKITVIEILEDVPISMELIEACKNLKELGYRIALDDHDFDTKWHAIFPYVDILKIDVMQFNILQISKYIRSIDHQHITLLAEKVETHQQYEQLKALGFQLFQGYFFARPEMVKHRKITPTKQNLFDLIAESSKRSMDLSAVTEVFNRDIGLTFKLLRYINSPAYGCTQKITSLKHALVFLGELEVKKFIAMLALANLNENKPSEIMRLSLARAKFCELIAHSRNDEENPPKSFLTGMLSLLDGMLDSELEDLLSMLPIHDEIKDALLGREGLLCQYLGLVIAAEKGDWQRCTELNESLALPPSFFSESYHQAIDWADGMIAGAAASD